VSGFTIRPGAARIGCVFVGPTAIALGLSLCVLGTWAAGWLLARPISPAEATDALRLHLSVRLSSDMQAELRARGLSVPDVEIARRWAAEMKQIRATRVITVSRRPSLLWFLTRGTRCADRMEIEAPAAAGSPARHVRYFRVDCGRLGSPRIVRETSAWGYRAPL
jgi:hypothetical protein